MRSPRSLLPAGAPVAAASPRGRTPVLPFFARAALGLAVLAALPLAAKESETLTLRYKLRQGDSADYRIRYAALATAAMPGADTDMTMQARGDLELRQRVAKVTDGGELLLETQVLQGKETTVAEGESDSQKLPPSKTLTRVDSRGVLLETRAHNPGAAADAGGMLGGMSAADLFQGANVMPFPKEPARIGTEWQDDMEVALEKGETMQVHTSSKLLGWVTCLGKQCAKMHTSYKATQEFTEEMQGMTMTATVTLAGEMTAYLAVANGLLVYSEDSVTAVIQTQVDGVEQMAPEAADMLGDMDLSTTVRIRANAKTVLKH